MLSSGTRLGPYEVISSLGAGGMGEVYRAKDPRLARDVAVKVLPEEFFEGEERRQRFEREAKLLAALNHPNIAAIYSFEESAGRHLLVMELVEGEALDHKVAAGPLPLEESLSLAKQIAEALEAAHERGIVHRDLKPANVKVTPDGRVKLLDFGLAKIFEGDGGSGSAPSVTHSPTLTARATAAGVILGTAAYMSPEQARGKPVDKRTDVWSFGCVLFEMLTGKRAFEGETVSDTLAAVLMKEPDWAALPEQTPAKTRDLLRKCLRREAKQRLHDVADARIELEEALALRQGTASASGPGSFTFEENQADPNPAAGRSDGARRGRGSRRSLYLSWALAAAFAAAAGALALRARAPQPALLRANLTLPVGLALTTDDSAIALSPDGKTLALTGSLPGQRGHLWLRPLDGDEPKRVADTDGATYPFWSPDGRWIGFFAGGKLRKVPAGGGAVQTICKAPEGRGASWNRKGTIVFTAGALEPLSTVPAAGGEPKRLTTLEGPRFTHRMPWFLPDGEHLLFSSGDSKEAATSGSLCVTDLATGAIRKLLAEPTEGRFVEPGTLLFVRGGQIMAQPFDARELRLSGEPIAIAQNVHFNQYRFTGNWAAGASGFLVYDTSPVAPRSQLTWFDLDGKELGRVGEPGQFQDLRLSPRGDRAAVVVRSPNYDIWIWDLARGIGSRATFGPMPAAFPVFSPDGKTLAYGDGVGGVWTKPLDPPGEAVRVLQADYTAFATSWSPDGRALALTSLSAAADNADLAILPLAGERKPAPYVATPAMEDAAAFSPDGKWITYTSNESGRSEVYMTTFPKPGAKWQVSTDGAIGAWWIEGGRRIAYQTEDAKLFAADVTMQNGAPVFGARKALFGGQTVAGPGDFAPDGRRILMLVPLDRQTILSLMTDWRAGPARQ